MERGTLSVCPYGAASSPIGRAKVASLRTISNKIPFIEHAVNLRGGRILSSPQWLGNFVTGRYPVVPDVIPAPCGIVCGDSPQKAFSSFRQFPIANLRVQPLFCMLADKSPSLRQSAKAPPRLSPGTALSWLLCKAIPHNGCCLKERESAASGRASAPPGCCWRCGWPPPWSRRPWQSPTSRPYPLCAGSATGAGGPVRSPPPAPAP